MGLDVYAVSRGYRYSEKKGDMIGSQYASAEIGYIGFLRFRNALVSFASGGQFRDIVDDTYLGKGLTWCFNDEKTFVVATGNSYFSKEDFEKNGAVIDAYLERLDIMGEEFPKLRAVFPLIAHSDCEGEIPLAQCKEILPVLREFRKVDSTNYGYARVAYNFTDELISVVEEAIAHRGKLYFC